MVNINVRNKHSNETGQHECEHDWHLIFVDRVVHTITQLQALHEQHEYPPQHDQYRKVNHHNIDVLVRQLIIKIQGCFENEEQSHQEEACAHAKVLVFELQVVQEVIRVLVLPYIALSTNLI